MTVRPPCLNVINVILKGGFQGGHTASAPRNGTVGQPLGASGVHACSVLRAACRVRAGWGAGSAAGLCARARPFGPGYRIHGYRIHGRGPASRGSRKVPWEGIWGTLALVNP